jgi:hypothetical protein
VREERERWCDPAFPRERSQEALCPSILDITKRRSKEREEEGPKEWA